MRKSPLNENRTKSPGIIKTSLILMFFLVLLPLSVVFAADPNPPSPQDSGRDQTIRGIGSEVNLLQRKYRDDVMDLYVKVPGGIIEVQRWYYENKWQWEHSRHKLFFTYDILEPEKIRFVASGGAEYGSGGGTSFISITSPTQRIMVEESEYRWTDKFGNWRFFDKEGRQISWGDRSGTIGANIYDAENKKVIGIQDRNNKQRIWFEYQGDNLISARDMQDAQDPACRKVEYAYSNNLLTSVKDVMGHITRYEYDAKNRLIKKIKALGFAVTINYNASGSVTSVLDAKGIGHTFAFNYDAGKREYYASIKSPGGMIKEVWFDQDSDTIRTDINGRTIRKIIKFNNEEDLPPAIRFATSGGGSGGETSMTVPGSVTPGGVGRHEVVIDERGQVTKKFYDEWENLTRQVYPDGSEINYEYDLRLNLVKKETNEQGIVTEKEYDGQGNLVRLKEAAGTPLERITEYGYSGGNLTMTRRLGDADTPEAVTSLT